MDWERIAIAAGVVLAAIIAARIVDRGWRSARSTPWRPRATASSGARLDGHHLGRRPLRPPDDPAPCARSPAACSPRRRSSGSILGLAAQRTLSNFVAGILIAVAQPVRLGDLITVGDRRSRRGDRPHLHLHPPTDGARLVIPNDTLASDTIRNSTIRSVSTVAEIKVQVPLAQDVAAAVDALREEIAEYDGRRSS